ncbi:MAG: hypothetical protein R3B09_27045 [Nannocystaceae bacterium]
MTRKVEGIAVQDDAEWRCGDERLEKRSEALDRARIGATCEAEIAEYERGHFRRRGHHSNDAIAPAL